MRGVADMTAAPTMMATVTMTTIIRAVVLEPAKNAREIFSIHKIAAKAETTGNAKGRTRRVQIASRRGSSSSTSSLEDKPSGGASVLTLIMPPVH